MPQLLIHSADGIHRMTVAGEVSVREALDTTTLRVRAACGGTGTCGACIVRWIKGEVSPPTLAEYLKITPEDRAAGIRLACQLRLRGDVEIGLEQPAPPSPWKSIPAENLPPFPHPVQPELESCIYGVAVDLGTTHIRVSLWDRRQGKRIASRKGPNPQAGFGADVLNRLESAHRHPEHGDEQARLARTAILQAIKDMLARDVGEVSPMLAEIGRVLIVGNSTMLALLSGRGRAALLAPENWQSPIDCQPPDDPDGQAGWQAQWQMPRAEILLAAPVAGFVGSDLLADLLVTGLATGPAGALLLDIGTNTEIALWDGRYLHLTSVPGGPAFEGVGIRHGMAAEPGAICTVRAEGDAYHLATLGDAPPRGYCGSGLVDAMAELRTRGILKPSGRFATPPGPEGYRLDPAEPCSAITGLDVDAFQRAKAALAAAVEHLLEAAGMDWSQLTRLCLCGAFGRTLHIPYAQALGLLPPLPPEQVELYADASLLGCEQALLAENSSAVLDACRARIRMVNLALLPDYENRYIDHLRLRPIIASAAPTTKT